MGEAFSRYPSAATISAAIESTRPIGVKKFVWRKWLSRQLFALALVLRSPAVRAEVLEGLVVAVADGDTLTVLDDAKAQHRI